MTGCKSALYASNAIDQELAIGDVINFGNAIRKFGCNLSMEGGNLVINGEGYYMVTANIDFTGQAGTTTITFERNGVPIPGAVIERTTVAGTEFAVSRTFIVKAKCCNDAVITAVISGVGATVNDAAITALKV